MSCIKIQKKMKWNEINWKRNCNIRLFVAILGCVYYEYFFFNKQTNKNEEKR